MKALRGQWGEGKGGRAEVVGMQTGNVDEFWGMKAVAQ